MSGDSKPPYVCGPKADGIHLCAFTGAGVWTPPNGPLQLAPARIHRFIGARATSPFPDHRISPRPCRFCAIATTLAVCPCGHLRVQWWGDFPHLKGGGRPSPLTSVKVMKHGPGSYLKIC